MRPMIAVGRGCVKTISNFRTRQKKQPPESFRWPIFHSESDFTSLSHAFCFRPRSFCTASANKGH